MVEVMLGVAPVRNSPPLHDPAALGRADQYALAHGGLQSLRNDFPILANMFWFQDGASASHLVASFEFGGHGCIVSGWMESQGSLSVSEWDKSVFLAPIINESESKAPIKVFSFDFALEIGKLSDSLKFTVGSGFNLKPTIIKGKDIG